MIGSVEQLSAHERDVIRRCLDAVVNGPFIPDWEFQMLFGLNREEVGLLLKSWPDTKSAELQDAAVVGALNQLLGYPHGESEAWSKYVGCSRDVLTAILAKWTDTAPDQSSKAYVDRLK